MAQQVATVDMPTFRSQLQKMGPQFESILKAAGIDTDAFLRVILTAVQNNPGLLKYDIRTLLSSAMKAAEDGLLPDGKQGAFVPFKGRVQWIPMIGGLRMKVYASGLVRVWDVIEVHKGDDFHWEEGARQIVMHIPRGKQKRDDEITHVYSRVEFKDGSVNCKVMTVEEIEQIRDRFSRADEGPWHDPMTRGEMRKKTVGRAHFKTLPTNRDIERVWSRLDDIQGIHVNKPDDQEAAARRRVAATSVELLDAFAGAQHEEPEIEQSTKEQPKSHPKQPAPKAPAIQDQGPQSVAQMAQNYLDGALKYVAGCKDIDDLNDWVDHERGPRGALPKEARETLLNAIAKKAEELNDAQS